jgi:hypothetical protein
MGNAERGMPKSSGIQFRILNSALCISAMPDRLDKLRATLSELEAELRDVDSLDEASREALADAADKISSTLRRGQPTHETKLAENSLKDQLTGFEASHPQLAGIVTRLIDGLGQLGI